jgi:pilus assembly protein Flp/PilA
MLELITKLMVHMQRDDEGATAVEYGLMVALIAGVIIAAVTALGGAVNNAFNTVVGAF